MEGQQPRARKEITDSQRWWWWWKEKLDEATNLTRGRRVKKETRWGYVRFPRLIASDHT